MRKLLMWIGAGVWVVIIAVALVVIDAPESEDAHAERAHGDLIPAAVEALEGHYDSIYSGAKCWTRRHSEKPFAYVRCGSKGSDITGGLFIVLEGGDGVQIFSVNGKAFQHADGIDHLVTSSGIVIPLSRWSGGRIDIPAVLALF